MHLPEIFKTCIIMLFDFLVMSCFYFKNILQVFCKTECLESISF